MEISTTQNTLVMQNCPHCGSQNPMANAFCKQCGEKLQQVPADQKEAVAVSSPDMPVENTEAMAKGKTKVVLIAISVLAIIGAAAGGGYYWQAQVEKKEAETFLKASAGVFQKTVAGINELSTEKNINEEDAANLTITNKKFEDEKHKIDTLQQEITAATDMLAQQPANQLVAPTETLLKQFFQEAAEKSERYEQFVDYNLKAGKEIAAFVSEMEKLKQSTKTVTNVAELRTVFVSLRDGIDTANNSIKTITPPTGMEQAHAKSVDMFTQISRNITGVISAIDENNEQKFMESLGALDESFSDTKALTEIRDLETYYFDDLHKQFVSLREKADKIRAEVIAQKTVLKVEVSDASIEGW